MKLLVALAAGMMLALVLPIFLADTREARGRLVGMFFGIYLAALGFAGSVLVVYTSIARGAIAIGRRGNFANFTFADQPILAGSVLLITLACTGSFTAFGLYLFNGARRGTLGP